MYIAFWYGIVPVAILYLVFLATELYRLNSGKRRERSALRKERAERRRLFGSVLEVRS